MDWRTFLGLLSAGGTCLATTEAERRQGLIPEAVRELLRHGFEDLKLNKIWCGYFEGNIKSKRVQEKCGFTYHHTNKDIEWKLMGDIRTEHVTCIDRGDYYSKNKKH